MTIQWDESRNNTDVGVCIVVPYAVKEEYDPVEARCQFTVEQLKSLNICGIDVRTEHGNVPIGVVEGAKDKTISKQAIFRLYPRSSPLAADTATKIATGEFPDVSLGQIVNEYAPGRLYGKQAAELSICAQGRRIGSTIIDFIPSVYTLRSLTFTQLEEFARKFNYPPPPPPPSTKEHYCDLLIQATTARLLHRYPNYFKPRTDMSTEETFSATSPPTEAESPPSPETAPQSPPPVPADTMEVDDPPAKAEAGDKRMRETPEKEPAPADTDKPAAKSMSNHAQIAQQALDQRDKLQAEYAAAMERLSRYEEKEASRKREEDHQVESEARRALTALLQNAKELEQADPAAFRATFPNGIEQYEKETLEMLEADPKRAHQAIKPFSSFVEVFSAQRRVAKQEEAPRVKHDEWAGLMERLNKAPKLASHQRTPHGGRLQGSSDMPHTFVEPPARGTSSAQSASALPSNEHLTKLSPYQACLLSERLGQGIPGADFLREHDCFAVRQEVVGFSAGGGEGDTTTSVRFVPRNSPRPGMGLDVFNPELFAALNKEVSASVGICERVF